MPARSPPTKCDRGLVKDSSLATRPHELGKIQCRRTAICKQLLCGVYVGAELRLGCLELWPVIVLQGALASQPVAQP